MSQESDDIKLAVPPNLLGACGRADLLYALASVQKNAGHELTGREMALAAIFGFFPKPEKQTSDYETEPKQIPPDKEPLLAETPELNDVFRPYRLVSVETVQPNEAGQAQGQEASDSGKLTSADMKPWDACHPTPKALPIVPWTRLWPRLRQAVACRQVSGIDYKRLTDDLARGIAIRQLPRLSRLSWPNPLTVVLDFSDRLTPYWDDWHGLRKNLQTRLHQQACFFRLHGVPQKQLQQLVEGKPSGRFIDWPNLKAGSTLLLVSDLGMVDPAHPWPGSCWQSKLNDYRKLGVRVVVLAPVSARQLQPSLVNALQMVRLSPDSTLRPIPRMRSVMESPFRSIKEDYSGCKTLMAMLSVATRAEPALLRDLRRCLPDDGHDAGLEGEVWCHQHLDTSSIACAISPYAVNEWREAFQQLPNALQQRTLDCIRDWHAQLPQAIHHEETLVWCHLTNNQDDAAEATHINRARAFFQRVTNSLQEKALASVNQDARALQIQLADRHLQWVSPVLASKESYIAGLSVAVTEADTERTAQPLPEGMDPIAWLMALSVQTPQKLKLIQQTDCRLNLSVDFTPDTAELGVSPLADLELDRSVILWSWGEHELTGTYRTWFWQTAPQDNPLVLPPLLTMQNESVKIPSALSIYNGRQHLRFECLAKPAWATGMGQDNYGLYAELELHGITQRFRWINPGTFLMGSPKDEPERSDDEQQHHQVTLTQGYWLADSACTQALWLAITSENPSRFKDNLNNPVENVSWDAVQAFIQQLNQCFPDLLARLPNEAEWEYACRAGTVTPFSFGGNITTDQVNYNGNYPYAGAAKGEFREKTLPVKSLPANPWGLYEMHGNVWEWCADGYGDYEPTAVIDPTEPSEGSYRVLRGGSWSRNARYSRSAFRSGFIPVERIDFSGFRLALGRTGVSPVEHVGRRTVSGQAVEGIRLHKYLAQFGKYGSLRSIEAKIRQGRILINGQQASIGDHYYPGDTIHIDDQLLDLPAFLDKTEVLLYYKTQGEVVSRDDPENRPTVFDQLPEPQQGRWIAVGRMGIKNEGLLLFATNGDLANKLSQKMDSIPCSYRVRVFGKIDNDAVARLTEGVVTEDGKINRVESIEPLSRSESANQWYEIRVNNGRSAYFDTLLDSQGIVYNRVIRTKFADIELPKDMKAREYKVLSQDECIRLMDLAGL